MNQDLNDKKLINGAVLIRAGWGNAWKIFQELIST